MRVRPRCLTGEHRSPRLRFVGAHSVNRFINVATSAQLVTWIAMAITWIRWNAAMKAQGVSRDILPYKSRFQPYGAYYALVVSNIWYFTVQELSNVAYASFRCL